MSGGGVLAALQSQGVDAHAFDLAERELGEPASARASRAPSSRCTAATAKTARCRRARAAAHPYTGSGGDGLGNAIDKVMTKRLWQAVGLPTPKYVVLPRNGPRASAVVQVPDELGLAADQVAAARGLVDRRHQGQGLLADAGRRALAAKYDEVVLCEEFIEGDELTCPVLARARTRARCRGSVLSKA